LQLRSLAATVDSIISTYYYNHSTYYCNHGFLWLD
jgi:hypothetical protein